MNIAILNDIHLLPEAYKQIKALANNVLTVPTDSPESEAELVGRTGNPEAILVSPGTKITASDLDACPPVKYVVHCGTSAANIDIDALEQRNITFTKVA